MSSHAAKFLATCIKNSPLKRCWIDKYVPNYILLMSSLHIRQFFLINLCYVLEILQCAMVIMHPLIVTLDSIFTCMCIAVSVLYHRGHRPLVQNLWKPPLPYYKLEMMKFVFLNFWRLRCHRIMSKLFWYSLVSKVRNWTYQNTSPVAKIIVCLSFSHFLALVFVVRHYTSAMSAFVLKNDNTRALP